MIWVLIMIWGSGPKALATHEFTTQARCEEAARQFVEAAGWAAPRAICVPK